MKKYYLGIDVGSISTKGVIIDDDNKIIKSCYMMTEGDPIKAVSKLLKKIECNIKISGVGTTGSARELIGAMVRASVIKNEITAHAIGTLSIKPDTKTILEIGGQDSKIILIENGIVVDYAMNTLCAAGTGSFLSSQAKRLNIPIEDFGNIALKSRKPIKVAARCTVFAESDLVHKMQMGYKKEDIIAGLCQAVASNYLNNVGKGKSIKPPIVFQGGVSKNKGVVKALEKELKEDIYVDVNGHLTGALGVAVLAKKSGDVSNFDFNISNIPFETKGIECEKCSNHCEIITIIGEGKIIDSWGNRCDRGVVQI